MNNSDNKNGINLKSLQRGMKLFVLASLAGFTFIYLLGGTDSSEFLPLSIFNVVQHDFGDVCCNHHLQTALGSCTFAAFSLWHGIRSVFFIPRVIRYPRGKE